MDARIQRTNQISRALGEPDILGQDPDNTEFVIRTIRDIDVPVSSPLIQDIPHISDAMRRFIHANDRRP